MKCKAETKSDRMQLYQEKMERKAIALAHLAKRRKRLAVGITCVVPEGGTGYGAAFKAKWPKVEGVANPPTEATGP